MSRYLRCRLIGPAPSDALASTCYVRQPLLSARSAMPVVRLASLVGEGEDPDRVVENQVDDAVRESRHRRAADWELHRNVRHGRSAGRQTVDAGDGRVDGGEEVRTEAGVLLVVPAMASSSSAEASGSIRT